MFLIMLGLLPYLLGLLSQHLRCVADFGGLYYYLLGMVARLLTSLLKFSTDVSHGCSFLQNCSIGSKREADVREKVASRTQPLLTMPGPDYARACWC